MTNEENNAIPNNARVMAALLNYCDAPCWDGDVIEDFQEINPDLPATTIIANIKTLVAEGLLVRHNEQLIRA